MDKNAKLRIILAVVIGLLIVALAALLISDASKNDWRFSSSSGAKALIVLAGLVISLVRLISGISSPRSLRIYEKAYKDEIGNAFSRSDNKKYKTKLLKALALYNENRFGDALKLLEELLIYLYKFFKEAIYLPNYCILGFKQSSFEFLKESHPITPLVFLQFRLR